VAGECDPAVQTGMHELALRTLLTSTDCSAGRGSDGANGGPGGRIQVLLGPRSTHLLFALRWNVKGGLGGSAGQHGEPGTGGEGGAGGSGHEW